MSAPYIISKQFAIIVPKIVRFGGSLT